MLMKRIKFARNHAKTSGAAMSGVDYFWRLQFISAARGVEHVGRFARPGVKTKAAQNFKMAGEIDFQMRAKNPRREQNGFARKIQPLRSWLGREDLNLRMAGIKIRCLTTWLRPNASQGSSGLGGKAGRDNSSGVSRAAMAGPDEICPVSTLRRVPIIRNRHSCLVDASSAGLLPLRSLQRGHCRRNDGNLRDWPRRSA